MSLNSVNLYWFLLPLIVSISLVYAASRHESWSKIWRHAARLALGILFVIGLTTLLLLALNGAMEWPRGGVKPLPQ